MVSWMHPRRDAHTQAKRAESILKSRVGTAVSLMDARLQDDHAGCS